MSQEIKCLKSRRARKVVPAQDIDMNQLMRNYGLESDSEESADEDFSPTNVESNSSEDSQNESSSSSSSAEDDGNDEVTSDVKQPATVPPASNSTTTQHVQGPSQQVKVSPQTLSQEQVKQKQQQQQLLVQFQQLPAELQQLVVQQLQAQKLPKQQQTPQQQSIQQQLQLQLAKLQLLQQQLQQQQLQKQLPKQPLLQQLLLKQPVSQQQLLKQQSPQEQLPQQQSPQQQSPQQQSPQQQSPQQQSPWQQLPQRQPSKEQTKKKQFLQPPHLKQQQQQQHLAQKQLSSQPQNTPVQFSQLPSKVQELLVKQLKQSGQGLQQLQQSKFLLLNAQQATSGSSSISSSSNSGKLQQKGEVQTGVPSKQADDNVTKITVMQGAQAGAVQTSSTSKQTTKKVVQIPAKQVTATAKQPPSQQKNEGQLHEKSQPQEVCIKDTANAKGVEISQQQTKRDDNSHPQSKRKKQRPSESTISQDSLHVDKEDAVIDQKGVETSPVVQSPVQKEVDATEALTRAVKKEVDIMLCFVCLEESKAGGEDMAQCDHCGITIHEGCYGVPEKSDDEAEEDARSDLSSEVTTPWFCDSCRAGVDQPSCELCPSTDGVFKQTIHGSWVHMVCSLYIPGVEYVEPEILSGVSLDQVPANKWGARVCQLCEDERYARTGVCISCDAGLCKSFFHVTCAQRQGLLCEEEENSEDDEEEVEVADPYYAYCKLHCNKDVAKSKRRNWLALMSRYKQFSCDHLDSRAKSALQDQRSQYNDLMEKMRRYYKPDEQCIKQERWLHHHPKAFQQLVKKAELLGHASDAIVTTASGRSKVTPSLTCDFVNYYIERNGRIKNLQELNDKLVLTNQLLSEDCHQLQEQMSAYELNQNSMQLQGVELQEQLGELYQCIQTGCGKPLPMPSFLSDDTGSERMDDQKSKKCSVCSSSSDQHLVITCDTCDKNYHISCLDPPLTKVPKKSTKYGWQCETCCCDSEDDLKPSIAPDGAASSRSGRVINKPSAYKQSEESNAKQKAKKRKK